MWQHGFELKLKEILNHFDGKVSMELSNQLFQMKQENESVTILFTDVSEEDGVQETLTFEEMYTVLVPKGKLDYLWLMDDVIYEINQEDAKEPIVLGYLKNLLHPIANTFATRKPNMEPMKKLVVSHRFVNNGKEYGQLALF